MDQWPGVDRSEEDPWVDQWPGVDRSEEDPWVDQWPGVDRSEEENPDHATMATVPNADLAVKVVAAPAVIAESTVSILINEETLPVKQAAFFFSTRDLFLALE